MVEPNVCCLYTKTVVRTYSYLATHVSSCSSRRSWLFALGYLCKSKLQINLYLEVWKG